MNNPECPGCHGYKTVRQVPLEPGYDPRLEHWCCDYCKIGWYQYPGQVKKQITGTVESARAAYVPREKGIRGNARATRLRR